MLQGLSRARIVQEEPDEQAYRIAQLELQPDPESPFSPAAADAQRRRLLLAFRSLFPKHNLDRVLRRALKESVPLGILCDVLADAMALESQVAYQVLAETDVKERCRLVLRLIEERLNAPTSADGADAQMCLRGLGRRRRRLAARIQPQLKLSERRAIHAGSFDLALSRIRSSRDFFRG